MRTKPRSTPLSRRRLLQGLGAAVAFPHIWIPNKAYAQAGPGQAVRHLIYIRLSGGFRFSAAFNGDVAAQFNPFGKASNVAAGTEWTPTELLGRSPFLEGNEGTRRTELGMLPVPQFTNQMCVLPCVDHEPTSQRADGNHATGLERSLTGYVGGTTSFLTLLNHGMRERVAQEAAEGRTMLPAFSMGSAGMALGSGVYAAFRPPVLEGNSFDRFGDPASAIPAWAQRIADNMDQRVHARLHGDHRPIIEAYRGTREATASYGRIFNDPLLKVGDNSSDVVAGISNRGLSALVGNNGPARRAALALRLFHFGCPAVFFDQGGYDYHSGEDRFLPTAMESLNHLISALHAALHRMQHPAGGTYWDHTLVVMGSEFGRSTGNQRFNSAGGSDHGSDNATRWMSMPFMGGIVERAGLGGRSLGETRSSDLQALGEVYSYRSVLKTLMDLLGADHAQAFPADAPIQEFWV